GTYKTDFHSFVQFEAVPDRNNFEIRVRSRRLGTSDLNATFPDYASFTSNTYLPYLLITSLRDASSGQQVQVISPEPILSDNASCLDAPFTYAVKKAVEIDS